MSFCAFSARWGLNGFCAVDNKFVTEWLPEAKGDYVKVYLFGLYLCSGQDESINSAQAMAEYLIEKGIPSRRILKEDKSQSTQENFLFSKELLSQNGVASADPIVFVTNRFHCYRAEGYAKRAGFENVRCIPAAIGPRSVLPSYLREVFAVLYFWCFA